MPEHVHLVLYPEDEDYSVSRILLGIKQSCARRVMIYCRQNDPAQLEQFSTGLQSKPHRFWQDGGGYDRNIIKRETLVRVID